MTDEQIEKILSELDECTCDDLDISFDTILTEVISYIRRLKDRIKTVYDEKQTLQTYIDNHEEIWKGNAEIDKDIVRKETAKYILQRVINICKNEEDFQDGTVNRQLEPLYIGIANGCSHVRRQVQKIAEEYGAEADDD